jgi:hygromycin-B 7''-O-kinase
LPFQTGSDIVWRAGEFVIKLSAPRWSEQIAWEARLLGHLVDRLAVTVPEVVSVGELDGWPYLIQRRVSGRALGEVWPTLDGPARRKLATRLGELCRQLHDQAAPTGSPDFETFWAECRLNPRERHAKGAWQGTANDTANDTLKSRWLESITPFLERVGELPKGPPALLHTELLGDHVLVAQRDGQWVPSGLIDFADGRPGAPEYELAAPAEFVFRGEPGVLAAFVEAYGWTERNGSHTAERALAWALLHRFGRLERALGAVRPLRPPDLPGLARALYGDLDRP